MRLAESATLTEMYHSPGAGNLSRLKSVPRICSKPSARGLTASPVFTPASSSPSSSVDASRQSYSSLNGSRSGLQRSSW